MKFVLVFGSNRKGIHGAGIALKARRFFGARVGIGEGISGQSYALPVREDPKTLLPLSVIRQSVERFYAYARKHPRTLFLVTRVGVTDTRAKMSYTNAQIAHLFADAPNNCRFHPRWKEFGLLTWNKTERGQLSGEADNNH